MSHPEYDQVERPLIDQLTLMGWRHMEGAPPGEMPSRPSLSGRADFRSVVLVDRFHAALHRLNADVRGRSWVTAEQLAVIDRAVLTPDERGVAANLGLVELLRTGITVAGAGVPNRDARLIDWEHPLGNDLLVVSQFRIDRGTRNRGVLDLLLFVNGLPLVAVECKRPGSGALAQAVEQLLGYAGAARQGAFPELVSFVQLLVATDREGALLGTITSDTGNFAPWRSTAPTPEAEVRRELGRGGEDRLHPQEILAAGVLRPERLLDMVRSFTVPSSSTSGAHKIVARYQQYRAVHQIAEMLRARQRAVTVGAVPQHSGGLIWHTQGSGKSYTMAFLVRKLRTDLELSQAKVVVVTDRLDLQTQIEQTLGAAAGETPYTAASVRGARELLARNSNDLVLITLQKSQRDEDVDNGDPESLGAEPGDADEHLHVAPVNTDSAVVVIIDEAHRGQDSWLHARLRAMLPNAIMVGFTGTPILSGDRRRTDAVFGPTLDTYALWDAQRDGAVVPVKYEARQLDLSVMEKDLLDLGFEQVASWTDAQRNRAIRRFAKRREVLEAPRVIAAKAADMFNHWVDTAMPDRHGAIVVAVSRKAAVYYRQALLEARDALLTELDALPKSLCHDPQAWLTASPAEQRLLALLPSRTLLASLDFAAVISGSAGDPEEWGQWTGLKTSKGHIKRFKAGTGDPVPDLSDPSWPAAVHGMQKTGGVGSLLLGRDPWDEPQSTDDGSGRYGASPRKVSEPTGPITFLTVNVKLLTGFDAPVAQVLYVDRVISGVGLFQAVTRTNRPYPRKEYGLVVDYIGIYRNLERTLGEYEDEYLRTLLVPDDEDGGGGGWSDWPKHGGERASRFLLAGIDDQDGGAVPLLRERSERVTQLLDRLGVQAPYDSRSREDLLAALRDPELRADFHERVRGFLSALNAVLPRPEALRYEKFVHWLGEVEYLARRRYREDERDYGSVGYGAKVRALIDRHLKTGHVERLVPLLDLTAPGYVETLENLEDDRARALTMESDLRDRLSVPLPGVTEPTRQQFSRRLEETTSEMAADFAAAVAAMLRLRQDLLDAEDVPNPHGLDRFTEEPVHSFLEAALAAQRLELASAGVDLVEASRTLALEAAEEAEPPHFLTSETLQERARRRLIVRIEDLAGIEYAQARRVAAQVIRLLLERRTAFLELLRRHGS